jgi:hypothetical protein
MNQARWKAVRRAVPAAGVLGGVFYYLDQVDRHRGTLPDHAAPFLVAFCIPALWVLIRAIGSFVKGETVPRGWPYGLHDEDGDQRPMMQRMWSRPDKR